MGHTTLAICNVVGSSIAREADGGVYLHAGPEVGVASTKAFTSQVCTLAMLALYFGRTRHLSSIQGLRMLKELRDLPIAIRLYAQPDFDNGKTLPLDDARKLLARFARYPDYTLYVAEQAGRIVGSFALLIMDNIGHLGTPSAIVEDVVVAPDMQSAGIGRAMMEFARELSAKKGCYKIVLSSNARRERAHAFYESLGFTRHGFSFRLDLPVHTP